MTGITQEIDSYIKKYVHTTDAFSHLYLGAWAVASWVPFPFLPALYVEGSGRNTLIHALCHISPEFRLMHSVKGLTTTPTILLDPPEIWTPDFFVVTAENPSPVVTPEFDQDLFIRTGQWIREYGTFVQEIYWAILAGARPDAIAPMTAVLMCVEEVASLSASSHQDVSVSEPEQEIAPDARERLNHA